MRTLSYYCPACDILIELAGYFEGHVLICPQCHQEVDCDEEYSEIEAEHYAYVM